MARFRRITWLALGALSFRVTEPARVPVTVGVKITETEQEPPGRIAARSTCRSRACPNCGWSWHS